MSQDTPFDRGARRLRRDRAAARFEAADYLHRLTAEELLERLDSVTRSVSRALILGGAGETLRAGLQSRGIEIVSADPSGRFAAASHGLQCDEDRLPFVDASFDLVVSIGLLDTVNDLPGALLLIRRALRPDGLFLGASGDGGFPLRTHSA